MAKYVEELPHLDLTPEQETRLIDYLSYELDTAESERQGFIDKLVEEIEAYEAPARPTKNFPWRGAANMTVPIIGSSVDTTFPRLHSTVFGSSTYISIEEWPAGLADHAKAWQDMLQWIMENELDIERVADSWIMEGVIHGTSVLKVTWERLEEVTRSYDEDGNIIKSDRRVIKNQPVLEHVALENFYIPFTARSIQDADWCAHRIETTYGKLLTREENGLYKNVDRIIYNTQVDSTTYTRAREEIEDTRPMPSDVYEIFEVWLRFDLDNNGRETPLLVTYHKGTRTLLRVQLHPYIHKRKPFREFVYFPRHDRFYGMGLARQLMPLQEEISTIHNQRLDNSTIANTRMWKVVAGSRADHSFQGAAPGMKVLVDDLDELDAIPMGDVGQSTFQDETVALQYVQQRSGIADFTGGIDFGKGGGRQTATQTVAMMQEARTRFNWTLQQIRAAIADIAKLVTDLYQQFGSGDQEKFELVLGEKADLVLELLSGGESLSDSPVSAVMALQVTASSASMNKAIEQQNLLALMQMMQGLTMQFEMPLIQLIMNPQTPQPLREYALEKIEGTRALMRRIMETSDVRNAAEILGSSETIRTADSATPAGPVVGGAVPGAGAAPVPGMGPAGVPMAGPMGGIA